MEMGRTDTGRSAAELSRHRGPEDCKMYMLRGGDYKNSDRFRFEAAVQGSGFKAPFRDSHQSLRCEGVLRREVCRGTPAGTLLRRRAPLSFLRSNREPEPLASKELFRTAARFSRSDFGIRIFCAAIAAKK